MNLDPGYFAGVARAGTPDHFMLLFTPADERENVRVLLALEHLLSQLSSQSMESQVRLSKLSWWAAEMERLGHGEPTHPVTRAAHACLAEKHLSPAPVLKKFAAVVREASQNLPGTPDELLEHAASSGAMIEQIAGILSNSSASTGPCSDVATEIGRARYLVKNLAAGHQCATGFDSANESSAMLGQLAGRQHAVMGRALATIPVSLRAEFLPLLVMAALLRVRLAAMRDGQSDAAPSQFSSLILAWRSARRASRGKLPAWPQ